MAGKVAKLKIPPDTPQTPWVRTSERISFNQCPQQWHWSYVERLRPYETSTALRFGTLVHVALEKYYPVGRKRGPHPRKIFEKVFKEDAAKQEKWMRQGKLFNPDTEEWMDMRELGCTLLDEYVEHYGSDENWEVLATEHAFHAPVYDSRDKLLFVYVGVVDLIVKDHYNNFVGLVDHKTTRDDPTKKGDALVLDEQTSAYWAHGQDAMRAAGLLKRELDGIIFNFLKKGKPDERPVNELGQPLNKDGSVSKRPTPKLFHRELVFRDDYDQMMARKRIEDQAQQMRYMRKKKLPVYKVPGTLHNPYCKWCPFKDMCEIHETGGDWESIKRTDFEQHNPYEQHAIYEGDTNS
jgi:hypothetical protein